MSLRDICKRCGGLTVIGEKGSEVDIKKVILESPYAGNIKRNTEYAKLCLKDSLTRSESPICSHLLFPQVLDDKIPGEREQGINAGLAWIKSADYHIFYIDYGWSPGMKAAYDNSRCKKIFRKIL